MKKKRVKPRSSTNFRLFQNILDTFYLLTVIFSFAYVK